MLEVWLLREYVSLNLYTRMTPDGELTVSVGVLAPLKATVIPDNCVQEKVPPAGVEAEPLNWNGPFGKVIVGMPLTMTIGAGPVMMAVGGGLGARTRIG